MNGQVVQLQIEQLRKGQFQETLEQLHIYSSSVYKKDIKYLKILFTELKQPTIVKPEIQDKARATAGEQTVFEEEVRQYVKDKKSLDTTLASLYNVVWGQCSRLLQNKLKSSSKYLDFDNNCDVATLLNEIKILSSKLEENTSVYDALHEAKAKLDQYQQSENDSLVDHMRNFKDLVNSVEYHGGDIFFDKDMMQKEMKEDIKNNIAEATTEEYITRTTEKTKAVAFIKSANRKWYGRLLSSIRDQHSFKIYMYPKTLADTYEMLSSHTTHNNNHTANKSKRDNKQPNNNDETPGAKISNSDTSINTRVERSCLQAEVILGTDGQTIAHITCYNCGKKGHYADNCPMDVQEQNNDNQQHEQFLDNNNHRETDVKNCDNQMMQLEVVENDIVHFSWTQVARNNLNRYLDTDILLDTGSIFSVFKNHKILLNISRETNRTLEPLKNTQMGGDKTLPKWLTYLDSLLYDIIQLQ